MLNHKTKKKKNKCETKKMKIDHEPQETTNYDAHVFPCCRRCEGLDAKRVVLARELVSVEQKNTHTNSDASFDRGQWKTNTIRCLSLLEGSNIRLGERVLLVPDLHARDAKGIDVHCRGVLARVQLWCRVQPCSDDSRDVLSVVCFGSFGLTKVGDSVEHKEKGVNNNKEKVSLCGVWQTCRRRVR